MIKNKLGQYFTTNIILQKKVFEFILNEPSNILESSFGRGDLIKYIIEKNYGFKISSMVLVQLHPTNKNYQTIKVPDLSFTVLELVNDRLKKLN